MGDAPKGLDYWSQGLLPPSNNRWVDMAAWEEANATTNKTRAEEMRPNNGTGSLGAGVVKLSAPMRRQAKWEYGVALVRSRPRMKAGAAGGGPIM